MINFLLFTLRSKHITSWFTFDDQSRGWDRSVWSSQQYQQSQIEFTYDDPQRGFDVSVWGSSMQTNQSQATVDLFAS